MEQIVLLTLIDAHAEVCFNLSRSIDFHKHSLKDSGEEAIGGVTSGLIGLNEEVTWRARHLGFKQQLTSRITALTFPYHFRDEMVKGIFKCLKHDHYFKSSKGFTVMKDVFEFESPFGIAGKIASYVYVKQYLRSLLLKRNRQIKEAAEGVEWKKFV